MVRSCARFVCKLFLRAWSTACASVNPGGAAAVCAYAPTARSSVGREFKNNPCLSISRFRVGSENATEAPALWTWNEGLTDVLLPTPSAISAVADQLPRSPILVLDTELLHAGLQGRASKAETCRSATWPRDFAVGFPQGSENLFALGGFFESRGPGAGVDDFASSGIAI